jgi:hypothetical protein
MEDVHPHSNVGRYASIDLCKVSKGHPQQEATIYLTRTDTYLQRDVVLLFSMAFPIK